MAASNIKIFFSAGGPATKDQKNFVVALKETLKAQGIEPKSAPFAARIEETIKEI